MLSLHSYSITRRKSFFLSLLLYCLFFSTTANTLAQPDKIEKVGERYGVELDVVFTYKPEKENLTRWKSVFEGASQNLYFATNGNFFLRKVNLFICPLEVEQQSFNPDTDVLIFRENQLNNTPGRLYNSQPIELYDRGRPRIDDIESVGHELCHYLFGIRDEYPYTKPEDLARLQVSYSLKTRPGLVDFARKVLEEQGKEGEITTQTTQDEQRLVNKHGLSKFNFRQFCSAYSFENPDSCIMDGASANKGIEYHKNLCTADDHVTGTFTVDNQSDTAVWSRNAQSLEHGESCRSTAERVLQSAYGLTVDLSVSRVLGVPPTLEFEEKDDCSEVVVLLLDKSGSMSGEPLAELKRAVIALIDLLGNDVKLGIIWFDSQPQAAVGIQRLGDARELAKQAVTPISAGGGTRIGFGLGVAYEQIRLFRDPDKPRGDEIIFLVTDGVSSDDTTTVVETIRNDGVKIKPIALGDDVDTFGLFEMAEQTGGRVFVARENEDITNVVVQGAAESIENYFVLSQKQLAPLTESIPVTVDAYVGRLLLQLNFTGIDTSAVQHDQFSFQAESGASLPVIVRSEILGPDSASVVLEINEPQAGVNTLQLPAGLVSGSSEGTLLALGQSTELQWKASIASGEDLAQYPDPVVIEAAVHSSLGSAHGMNVEAIVIRPDGSVLTLTLFDDGSPVHGDEIANDGLYSAKFTNYNGDGTYQVKVTGSADETTLAGAGAHTISFEGAETFEPFSREQSFSFEVVGFETPVKSTVIAERLPIDLEEQAVDTKFSGSTGVIVGGFKISIGPGQGARLQKMTLQPSGVRQDLDAFQSFAIYIDSDEDGLVDFAGPTSVPQSVTTAILENETITLNDILELEGDSEVNILVVGLYQTEEEVVLVESGFPLLFVPILLFLGLLARKRRCLALVPLLCLILMIASCGDKDSFVFTNPGASGSTTPEVPAPREFRTGIDLDSIEAVGRIDGEPIQVEVIGESALEGPLVNIR